MNDRVSANGSLASPDVRTLTIRKLLAPVILLVGAFCCVAAALIYYSADQQNDVAEAAGRHLAASAVSVVRDEVRGYVRDYAYWNDTVQNLLEAYNPEWADNNVGNWAIDNLAMDGALVLGGDNRVIHSASHGAGKLRPGKLPIDLPLPGAIRELVGAARDRAGEPGEGPQGVAGFFRDQAGIHLAAASAITWEDERAVPLEAGGPGVLLFFRTLDEAVLADLEARFLLDDLRLLNAVDSNPSVAYPLKSVGGHTLAYLQWTADRPGSEMLSQLATPLMACAAVFLVLIWVIVRRSRHAAMVIQDNQIRLEQQAIELAAARDQATRQAEKLAVKAGELRAARDSADAANRAKSQFLAMMSHELRTPLNAVLGFADMLQHQSTANKARDRVREYAGYIHFSGTHLLSLIDDILDLSKIEAGRYELYEEAADLDHLIEQSLTMVRGRAGRKGVTLTYTPCGLRVHVDMRAIKQVLVNLLSNAVKFSPEDAPVAVEVSLADDELVIAVSDRGPGMSQEDLEEALEPFGQVRNAQVRNDPGTGLGLPVSRALSELHGGSLDIRTAPGSGTTVLVRIPHSRVVQDDVRAAE